jgi:hypothetical protein
MVTRDRVIQGYKSEAVGLQICDPQELSQDSGLRSPLLL